jgi:hypothetical protein
MKSTTYMNRMKGVAVALGLALLLASHVPPAPTIEPPALDQAELRFEPVALDEEDPSRDRLGPLRFLGGWAISSRNGRFGSISGMHVEGGQVTAVSDSGVVSRFSLPNGPSGRVRLETLAQGPGPASDKTARDAETLLIRGDHAWISFENRNAVWRYDRATWRAQAAARPEKMRRWPVNSGSEGLVRLADGRFLIMAESIWDADGSSRALLFDGDPAVPGTRAVEFRYRPPAGYRVTDAALLPDGRLLVLHRRFTLLGGFRVVLTAVRLPERIAEGMILSGQEIARFEPPVVTDNYEALSVTQEGGRTILWIASDDNYFSLQRTLLLRFAVEG